MDKKTLILVDSSTTLTNKIAKENGIIILPLMVYKSNEKENKPDTAYLYESFEMTNEDFLKMSESGDKFKTGATPIGIIEEVIDEQLKNYDQIISLSISKKWSSQYEHLKGLSNQEKYKDKLFVIDTKEFGYNTEYLALELRKRINSGIYTIDELIDFATNFNKYVASFFLCRSFDGLVNSGRIPKIIAKLLKFAKIYPIIKVDDGENKLEGIIKNTIDSNNKIIKSIYKSFDNKLSKNNILKIGILTACNSEEYINEVKQDIMKAFDVSENLIEIRPAPTIFINIVMRNAICISVITNKEKN
ncbi:MAG: DegV family protein [Ureaplasma sp.]|nr:DegV family protein [Ureaplasma sp.]MDE7221852.1 DegV family protein [Ureaplasma sp.]